MNSTLRPHDREDEMDTKEPEEKQQKVKVKVKARESPADQGRSQCATTAVNQDTSQGSAPNQREEATARTEYPQATGSSTTQVSFPDNGTTGGKVTTMGKARAKK